MYYKITLACLILVTLGACTKDSNNNNTSTEKTAYVELKIDGVLIGKFGRHNGENYSYNETGGGLILCNDDNGTIVFSMAAGQPGESGSVTFNLGIPGGPGKGTYTYSRGDSAGFTANCTYYYANNAASAYSYNWTEYTRTSVSGGCNAQQTSSLGSATVTISENTISSTTPMFTGTFSGVFYENTKSEGDCVNSTVHTFSGTFYRNSNTW